VGWVREKWTEKKNSQGKNQKLLLYLTDRWTDKYRSAVNGDLFFYYLPCWSSEIGRNLNKFQCHGCQKRGDNVNFDFSEHWRTTQGLMVSFIFLKHCYKCSFSKHYLQLIRANATYFFMTFDWWSIYLLCALSLYMCDCDFVSNKLLLIVDL
jgi:hypothetical protein